MREILRNVSICTPGELAPLVLIGLPPRDIGAGEVLVRVDWTASSPLDLHRSQGLVPARYPVVIGTAFAGVVLAVGPPSSDPGLSREKALAEAARLRNGDRVFGYPDTTARASAGFQTMLILGTHLVSKVPPAIPLDRVVTVPTDLVAAFHAITHDLGLVLPWPKPADYEPPSSVRNAPILIWGAGSSVGSYAIQLLRHWGYAHILAASDPAHHNHLRSLGVRKCFDNRSPMVAQHIDKHLNGGDDKVDDEYDDYVNVDDYGHGDDGSDYDDYDGDDDENSSDKNYCFDSPGSARCSSEHAYTFPTPYGGKPITVFAECVPRASPPAPPPSPCSDYRRLKGLASPPLGTHTVEFILDCFGTMELSLKPLGVIATAGTRVAVMLPVAVWSASRPSTMPELQMAVPQELLGGWPQGVVPSGVESWSYCSLNPSLKWTLQPVIVPALLASGAVEPHPRRVLRDPYLLDRAEKALSLMWKKSIGRYKSMVGTQKVTGEKLVWRISDDVDDPINISTPSYIEG